MATTTTNSNINTFTNTADHTPHHSTISTTVTTTITDVNSPQSRCAASRVSSPWTQIVRGESESIAAATQGSMMVSDPSFMAEEESLENDNGSAGNVGKRPVWNKPSNVAVEIGPVMGAVSWPALSESARASPKSSSESLKSLSDGSSSVFAVQGLCSGTGTGTGNFSSSSQKQASNSASPNSTPHHTIPLRQRSMKRNVANNSSNGGASQPPGSQGPVGEVNLNNPSTGDNEQRSLQSWNAVGDHQQQQQQQQQQQHRNSFRNRNGGPRGDGSHHHNYGGRRDQDRANQDWNSHRNFNGRDNHMQTQRLLPRFMRHPTPPPPPPTSTPYVAPQPVRPFSGPMGFPEITSPVYYLAAPPPESLRGVPFVATPLPPHPVFFPPPDLQLHSRIVNQIDYYFSNENLVKDTFLRQNMDDQGWVPIKLIAGFNKVAHLTDNIQLILDAVRNSTIVEVQGDKVRRRNDWHKWLIPTSVLFPSVSSPQSTGKTSHDMVAGQLQGFSLEEMTTSSNNRSQADVHTDAFLVRSSRDIISEGTCEVGVQGCLDRSTPARNLSK